MFFKKKDKLGREIYLRPNGKRVSKAAVKKSKKKVVSVPQGKKYSEIIIPKKVIRAKEVESGKLRDIELEEITSRKKILAVEIMQQRVFNRIRGAYDRGEKVAIKYKGQIIEVDKSAELELTALWESLESKFLDELAVFNDSPTMTLGAIETMKGVILDFDQINYFDEEIFEELQGEYGEELSQKIKKVEKYFDGQFKKFKKNL